MTTPETPPQAASQDTEDSEINLLDLLIVLAKHKKLILGLPLLAGVLVAGITLLMPNIYTATTKILPPQQQQSSAAALLGQLGGLAGAAGSSLGLKNPNDLYVSMLGSRTIADNLIRRFDLMARFESKHMDSARKTLQNKSKISSGKDGIITIEFSDKDPAFSANVANAYVEELYKLTQTLAVTQASQRRLFFEKQLNLAKEHLASAEMAMKQTQEKTGLLQLDAQGASIISAVGNLRAQIAAKEVQLSAMHTFATKNHPDYVLATQELAGLKNQLSKLEDRGDTRQVPTGKLPETGLEYVRKLREVKYHETLFELLAKQYELAKIDEARDASVIQVMDKAIQPDIKSSPKRAFIVVISIMAMTIISIIFAFFREAKMRRMNDPVQLRRIQELRRHASWRNAY